MSDGQMAWPPRRVVTAPRSSTEISLGARAHEHPSPTRSPKVSYVTHKTA